MTSVSISGFKYIDSDGNGRRASTLIKGSNPDVVLVLDVSGSTTPAVMGAQGYFRGTVDVGDLDLDGYKNTILDAEISSAGSVLSSLLTQGFGSSRLGLVSFSGTGNIDFNGRVSDQVGTYSGSDYSFYEAARSLTAGGSTNYNSGLRQAQLLLDQWGTKEGNVIFLSDGEPNTGYGTNTFQILEAAGHNVQAFGVGSGATELYLNQIDSDGSSYIFQDPDELNAVLNGQLSGAVLNSVQYSEDGLAGVKIYVDTNANGTFDFGEPTGTTNSDGNYTISDTLTAGTYSVREVIPTGYSQTEIPGQIIVEAGSTTFTGVNFGNKKSSGAKTYICDYLNFTPDNLPDRPSGNMAMYYDYVDRYNLTLKDAFIADYKSGKSASQHLWGQQHWLSNGQYSGRVLEVVTGTEDTNDYGAYVENYGTTLLDIYRGETSSDSTSNDFQSLFNWGKSHYENNGKAAGRELTGGVDWGAIVLQNFDLYTQWQDAKLVDPNVTAFKFGYSNQNTIKAANGVQVGRDTQETLTGQYAFGLGGNDVLTGTANDDLLVGGFGDDLICSGNGGTDVVFGGPGKDVFTLHSGGSLDIRDYRKGADLIKLGSGLTESDVKLVTNGFDTTTEFMKGSETLATVYGLTSNDFSFANESDGIDNVFIA